MNRWTYVIGDIHGCYEELLELEKHLSAHANHNKVTPYFVSVGDLIDRGPFCRQVLEHFMQGVRAGTHYVIAGNHEAYFVELLHIFAPHNLKVSNGKLPPYAADLKERFEKRKWLSPQGSQEGYFHKVLFSWIEQGGSTTLQSFNVDPFDIQTWNFDPNIMAFLCNMTLYWENGNCVVTHALASESDLKYVRNLYATGHLKRNTEEHNRAVHGILWNREMPKIMPDAGRIHVSGHTPLQRPNRSQEFNLIQIDTGCVYGGRLSAYCLESDELLSVPSKQKVPH